MHPSQPRSASTHPGRSLGPPVEPLPGSFSGPSPWTSRLTLSLPLPGAPSFQTIQWTNSPQRTLSLDPRWTLSLDPPVDPLPGPPVDPLPGPPVDPLARPPSGPSPWTPVNPLLAPPLDSLLGSPGGPSPPRWPLSPPPVDPFPSPGGPLPGSGASPRDGAAEIDARTAEFRTLRSRPICGGRSELSAAISAEPDHTSAHPARIARLGCGETCPSWSVSR